MAGRLFLFAGGGTGGHLFPGIAVAESLVRREPDARIVFAGTDRSIERDILSRTSFEHYAIPSANSAGAVRRPLQFFRRSWAARREAVRLVKSEQPSVVIGCGGFASAAPVYAASRCGVPFVLLEQNVIPGRATRWLSRLGGTVCLSFEQTAAHLARSARSIVTGNPVRATIASLAKHEKTHGKPTVLVLGGSQGARSINDRLIAFVQHRADVLKDCHIIHQTGTNDVEWVRDAYATHQIDAEVATFFDRPAELYERAWIVVSRAGGTSLAEIACAGLPAVLLPYPHATDDHQRHNALPFQQAKAAYLVAERPAPDDEEADFETALTILLTDPERRELMAANMRRMACPDAAAQVADIVLSAATTR